MYNGFVPMAIPKQSLTSSIYLEMNSTSVFVCVRTNYFYVHCGCHSCRSLCLCDEKSINYSMEVVHIYIYLSLGWVCVMRNSKHWFTAHDLILVTESDDLSIDYINSWPFIFSEKEQTKW